VIFRLGGAACLLTNKAAEKRRAKYALEQCLRTHTGADDDAFSCMSVKLDPHGVPGVFLPPPATLAAVTKKSMTANVTRLGARGRALLCGPNSSALLFSSSSSSSPPPHPPRARPRPAAPLVMPLSEKLRFAKRWLAQKRGRAVEAFRPDFTKCFEHASIHAGGRIVIEAVGGAFGLPTDYQVRGRWTLHSARQPAACIAK
jgi:3-ketoacyl-CoA synthase